MQIGVVNSLTFIKNIKQGLDYCSIIINDVPYMLFGSYNENMQFINKRVLYDTHPDMYEGKVIEVVTNVVEKTVIQTVAEEKGVKLIPDNKDVRPICNYAFDSIKSGDRLRNVIVYLSAYTVEASAVAKWFELQVVDVKSKLYRVRYFSSHSAISETEEYILSNMVGKYVTLNSLVLNKYGFTVEGSSDEPAVKLNHIDVLLPPEVEVAINIIEDMTKNDIDLLKYMTKYDYINKLKNVIDVEPGFHLVRVATELLIIKMLSNVTSIYSEQTLIRTAICAKGYLIDKKNDLSKPILNINKIIRSDLSKDIALIDCLDVMSEHTNPVKRIYIEIAKFSNFIVDERRGLIDEKAIIAGNNVISNQYGRLL